MLKQQWISCIEQHFAFLDRWHRKKQKKSLRFDILAKHQERLALKNELTLALDCTYL